MHSTAPVAFTPRAADFLHLVRRYADRVAVFSRSEPHTFLDLGRRAAALAAQLRESDVKPGEFVGVFLGNGPEAVWASYGVMLSGACEVQLNAGLSAAERSHCLSLTPPKLVITSRAQAAPFAAMGQRVLTVEDVGSHDPFTLKCSDIDVDTLGRVNFTSGTTGLPKAIVATHVRRWLGNLVFMSSLPVRPTLGSSILLVTPFSHGAGLFTHAYLGCGASVTLLDGMDLPLIERLFETGSVDALFGSPTVFAKLSQAFAGRRFDGLRSAYCGTASLSSHGYGLFKAIFGPIVALSYGKTETHSPIALLPADETDRFFGGGEAETGAACLGWPSFGVDIEIIDASGRVCAVNEPGEIYLRANHMANGWIDAEGFHDWGPSGRHATGDLGFFDAKGRLRLAGRSNDVIKTGGYKLFPAEVESALATAGVEATVIGFPSNYWGQIVVAVSEAVVDEAAVTRATAPRLAAYRRPRAFLQIEALPRNAQGKIVRRELLRLVEETYALIDGPYPRFERKR